jgi:hypothetical protein
LEASALKEGHVIKGSQVPELVFACISQSASECCPVGWLMPSQLAVELEGA